MSVIKKDLGIATAYGYARSKGYTGTEEEFAELMASYADMQERLATVEERTRERVASLDGTDIAGSGIFEAVGNPVYVDDVTAYSEYGITETGWYVFGRVTAKDGVTVTEETTVEGAAGYIAEIGAAFIDVAVCFEVAAVSQKVVVNWGSYTDTLVFKATDLAVRNLDYRVTFYMYAIDEFATWEYALTTDTTFQSGAYYYVADGEEYTLANPVIGDPVPAYYIQVESYALTTDATFAENTTYYTKDGEEYTEATVTTGETVTADTYYVKTTSYAQATGIFEEGVTYYTKSGDTYTEASVTAGEAIPAYYNHSHVTFEGMARNITYVCNVPIDCPMTFVLPEIEDETHGCWYEIRFRHMGSYSSTLQVPEGVKVATEHTQAETAGINMVNLHYTAVEGVKLWRFMNTHSTIPTT